MTKRQSFAIFCATGVDVRGIHVPQFTIDQALGDDPQGAREALIALGGIPRREIRQKTDFSELWAKAEEAGRLAANAQVPKPMTVVQHASPLDDSSEVVQAWHVPDGVCGFAWISFKGNTAFGRWAKKTGIARKGYPNGLTVWISDYNQSYERKYAHAQAAASVLREAGISAYADGRLD